MNWSRFSPEEVERRKLASIAAMQERNQAAFEAKYQEDCDRLYWLRGQCCAGCDHWNSEGGWHGECTAAGIMSGADVMRSLGIDWSSHAFRPGFPHTDAKHACGLFQDAFDWATLDVEYLRRIGAIRNSALREKPQTVATLANLP